MKTLSKHHRLLLSFEQIHITFDNTENEGTSGHSM